MTQGLYNIDNNVPGPKETQYLEAGIHENIKFTDVEYKTTVNNNEFLSFTFENEKGHKGTHTEWPFKGQITENTLFIIVKQVSLLKQIGEAIVGKGNFNVQAESFKDMAQKVVNLLKPQITNKLFRLKVVYDNRGYTSLANNPNWTFIEPMSIPKEESKIQILSNDKMSRQKQDKEDPVSNILDNDGSTTVENTSSQTNANEFPF